MGENEYEDLLDTIADLYGGTNVDCQGHLVNAGTEYADVIWCDFTQDCPHSTMRTERLEGFSPVR